MDPLLFFALKYKGDWHKIYQAISQKEAVNEEEFKVLKEKQKNNYITILDDLYPDSIRKTITPPFVLFYEGNIDLLKKNGIATVVGSRKPTEYGLECTENIVKGLGDYHYCICSGLALGIDACAHKSAIASGLLNIAVVANGIDQRYPHSNGLLYDEIVTNGGLILSEYPDGVEPTKDKFNMRNRILSALGDFLIVTEAFQRSGTLLTVKHALYQGKDIFVFPTQADHTHINNTLIKDGATLIENVDDLLLEFKKF